MLTITREGNSPYLNVTSAYPYAKRIRKLSGARWNPGTKSWLVPVKSLDELLEEFKGELYFKTPLWEIKGEPAPDMSALYTVDENIKLPETKIKLYPYQQFGARFVIDRVRKNGFAICADGCGLGKTPTAIAAIKWFAQNRNVKRILLVVKKSIKEQWAAEIDKFSDLSEEYTVIYTGETQKKRMKAYETAVKAEKAILITNYHNFLNDTEIIKHFYPEIAVIDEAHCIKARTGVMNNNISTVVRNIPVIYLTGTPILNKPEDLFGIVSISEPCYFNPDEDEEDQWTKFKKKYIVTEYSHGYEATIGAKNLDELREKCQNVIIRRTEHEVAVEMPDVTTKDLRIEPDEVQTKIIEMCLAESQELGDERDSIELLTGDEIAEKKLKLENLLKGMIGIRQIAASDPLIMKRSSSKMVKPYVSEIPKSYKGSPKTEALVSEVEDILDSGEKAIIFTKYIKVGEYIAEVLEKKTKRKILMYTGNENQEQRAENVSLFRTSDEYPILIGTDAMAEGLNLAEARHVINYDLPDTYAIYMQRMGRVRRVSSTYKNVIVHNLLTKGSADEQKMNSLMRGKDMDGAIIAADKAQSSALSKASNF